MAKNKKSDLKTKCHCGALKDKRSFQCKNCWAKEPKEKRCTRCHKVFPIEEFSIKSYTWKKSIRYKRRSRCKKCRGKDGNEYRKRNHDKVRKNKKIYYHNNRETAKMWSFRTSWKNNGFDPDEIVFLFKQHKKKHDGHCDICGKKEIKKNAIYLALDHCHKTKILRGFLCSKCNFGIGLFNDDIKLLKKAIKYLRMWNK